MRLLVDTVAGTRGFAVAPIERFTVSSNGLIQLNGGRRLYEETSLDEKGTTASLRLPCLRATPNPMWTHRFRSFICIGRALRAFVRIAAIVVRSGGQSVVQARQCLGSWHRLFIAEVHEGWKACVYLASPAMKGTI